MMRTYLPRESIPNVLGVALVVLNREFLSPPVSSQWRILHCTLCWFLKWLLSCALCRFFNNAYYAKVGGVSTSELNRLEMKFLFSIDFRLHVSIDTFQRHCLLLEKEASEGLQIELSIQSCRITESWSNKDDSTWYSHSC